MAIQCRKYDHRLSRQVALLALVLSLAVVTELKGSSTSVHISQDPLQTKIGDVVEFKERNEIFEGRVTDVVGTVIRVKYHRGGVELTTSMQASEAAKVTEFEDQPSRQWRDDSGKFELEAKLLRERKDSLVLESTDGRQMQVAKSRLSAADREYLAAAKRELETTNPFVPMAPVDGSLPALPPRDPERPKIELKLASTDVAKVEFLRLDDVLPWKVLDSPQASWSAHSPKVIGFDPNSIGRTSRHIKDFVVAATAPIGVLNLHSYGRESELTHWLVRLNLDSGQIEREFPMPVPDCEIIDVSPNGELVLTIARLGNNFDQHAILLWRFGPQGIEYVAGWEALLERGLLGNAYSIKGRFTANNQFCLWSHGGKLVFWNLETNQPEWGVEISTEGIPWFSDDGKSMLFGTNEGVTQIDTVSRKCSGFIHVKEGALRHLAVSPDGNRIAIVSLRRCRILAVPSGEIVQDFTLPDFSIANSIRWCPGDQLLFLGDNSVWQVDLRLRLVVWQYMMPSGHLAQRIRNRAWFALDNNSRAGAIAVEIPSQKSMDLVDSIKLEEVESLGPGSTVSLLFETPFGEQQVSAIRSKWTEFLASHQIKVSAESQRLQFKCKALTGSRKATEEELQRLALFGKPAKSLEVNSLLTSVELLENGQPIWNSTTTIGGIDYVAFSRRNGEPIEQTIARMTNPDPAYFESFRLPVSVTRFPPGIEPGSTTVSLRGAR